MATTSPEDVTDQINENLVERLDYLNHLTAAKSEIPIIGSDLLSHTKNLYQQLHSIPDNTISTFLSKFDEYKDIIDVKSNNKLDVDSLDVSTKREIILNSEEELINLASQLQDLDVLKKELDYDDSKFKDMHLLIPKLRTANAVSVQNNSLVNDVVCDFGDILDSYNVHVQGISKLFTIYHNLLSEMESRVDTLEKEQLEQ